MTHSMYYNGEFILLTSGAKRFSKTSQI